MVARVVSKELGGGMLDGVVRALFETSWGEARTRIERGKISVHGVVRLDPRSRVREGDAIEFRSDAAKPRPAGELSKDAVVHLDTQVVVIDKPSGVSTIPFDENETGTLDERVRDYLAKRASGPKSRSNARPNLGIVHRLDKETSGLIVFTRTWLAKESLTSQFRAHTVHRKYFAIVHGAMKSQTIQSHLVQDRGDGLRGSIEKTKRGRAGAREGQRAVTHVEFVEALDGASLVACRLETGRTHQIRVHLSEAGHPLLGERVYIRGYQGEEIPAPRVMLHAAELGFVHPKTELQVQWSRDWPRDFDETVKRLLKR
jgi:23S rRNA pseudouridine1911/1915/1917 synthase